MYCLTPNERVRLEQLNELLNSIDDLIANNAADHQFLMRARMQAQSEVYLIQTYTPKIQIEYPFEKVKNMETISKAVNYFGRTFGSQVGFEAEEVFSLTKLLFESENNKIKFENKNGKSLGVLNSVEVTLLICIRLRGYYSTWTSLSWVFGRDPALLCKVWSISIDMILYKFGWTININYLDRFKKRMPMYRSAISKWYDSKSNFKWSHLSNRIQNISVLLDGVRILIPRPKEHHTSMYTGYKCQYNVNLISVWAPDGMCLCLAPPTPGFYNDSAVINEFHINEAIGVFLGAAAVADGIFAADNYIIVLRDDLDCCKEELAILKSMRGSVEHGFCMLKKQYPLLEFIDKMKLAVSHPIQVVWIAFIFNNFKCCCRGNQISKRFNLISPSLQDFFT